MPSPLSVAFRFDGRNVSAQERAARHAARYVTRVSDETRQAINSLIVRSIRDGVTPYETSRLIRSTVGLTSQGTAAVMNFYQAQVRSGTTVVRAQALADRYAQKLLNRRALTIARTEVMGALNGGALEQARQRRDAGLLRNPQKRWSITPDEVTCEVCRPLQGETVDLEAQFSVGVMAPPAHPSCRCSVKFLEGPDEKPVVTPLAQAIAHLKQEKVEVELPSADLLDQLTPQAADAWEVSLVTARLRLAAGVKTALDEAGAAFQLLDLAEPVKLKFIGFTDVRELASASQGVIKVNLLNQSWLSPVSMSAKRDLLVARRYWPDGVGPGSTLVHEYAHLLHQATGEYKSYRTWAEVQDKLGVRAPRIFARRVSVYAEQNPREFVAEAFMAQVYGRQLEPQVLDMYRKLGGPAVPGPQ